MPAKVAPPLKSTSTRLSCSGECVIASPSTSVRRNSDLPDPVAPITSPWGPMPCWALSLMSRWIRPPPSPSPIGTRSRSRAGRVRHAGSGSNVWTSPNPSRSMKSLGPVISPLGSASPDATVWSGVSRRASASAVARSHWSPVALTASSRSRSASTGTRPRTGGAPVSSSRSRLESSSSSQRVGRSSTVTPCRPSGGTTWLPGGSVAPSVTSRMCGVAARSSAPNRGRSPRSGGSSAARPSSEVVTIRFGPTASLSWPLRLWGSHFSQSQWMRFRSVASTATTRCSGAWKAAAEQSRARASERAGSSSPQTSIRSNARRSMLAGRSGCSRWTTSSRWSAEAAAGSTWSTGALCGGTSSVDSGWVHVPYRTCRKWSSALVCSQTRVRSSASAGSAAGSGWCQVRARRCCSAASRATVRMLAR